MSQPVQGHQNKLAIDEIDNVRCIPKEMKGGGGNIPLPM
jgi:hypothetical protein